MTLALLVAGGALSRAEARSQARGLPVVVGSPREALDRVLLSADPAVALDFLVEVSALDDLLPEIPALRMEQAAGCVRHKDNYAHTLKVLTQAIALEDAPDLVLRMASLLHDIGKPDTREYVGSEVTFQGHDIVGGRLARRRLRELGYPEDFIAPVVGLIEMHLRTFGYRPGKWTDSGVRRYVTDAGELLPRLNKLIRADVTTGNVAFATTLRRAMDDLEAQIVRLEKEAREAAVRPALNGAEVMELLGLAPGPEVGRAMRFLLEHKRSGTELTPDEARDLLRAWSAEQ